MNLSDGFSVSPRVQAFTGSKKNQPPRQAGPFYSFSCSISFFGYLALNLGINLAV